MGYAEACWPSAASYDRWCMYRGLPQRYGTQIVPHGVRFRVWDVDGAASDAARARLGVPPLREQEARAAKESADEPQPDVSLAPRWLREAIVRWRS